FVERGVAELLGDFDDPARLSRVEEEVPVTLNGVLDAVENGQQRVNGTHATVRVTGVRATKEDHFIDVERDLLTVRATVDVTGQILRGVRYRLHPVRAHRPEFQRERERPLVRQPPGFADQIEMLSERLHELLPGHEGVRLVPEVERRVTGDLRAVFLAAGRGLTPQLPLAL